MNIFEIDANNYFDISYYRMLPGQIFYLFTHVAGTFVLIVIIIIITITVLGY